MIPASQGLDDRQDHSLQYPGELAMLLSGRALLGMHEAGFSAELHRRKGRKPVDVFPPSCTVQSGNSSLLI